MKEIKKSIESWVKKNNGDVCFTISCCSFDKKGEVKDDFVGAYGVKKCVKVVLDELKKEVVREKGDFINL